VRLASPHADMASAARRVPEAESPAPPASHASHSEPPTPAPHPAPVSEPPTPAPAPSPAPVSEPPADVPAVAVPEVAASAPATESPVPDLGEI
jgi:hypothetical protein